MSNHVDSVYLLEILGCLGYNKNRKIAWGVRRSCCFEPTLFFTGFHISRICQASVCSGRQKT